MNQEEYIEKRLAYQFKWYDDKSVIYQKRFKRIRIMEIVFAASIPLLSAIPGEIGMVKLTIATLGAAITIIAGINAMNKYHELWISYRSTAEMLKHHQFLFETQCTPYDKKDAFKKLVENTESILSNEQGTWTSMFNEQINALKTEET
ncbi:MAG: DUF4231 domain-containing protein [Bacteroidota bacterium]